MWLCVLAAILTGYLLGNLNGAVCVSLAMRDDVRSHGSGNAGLTNFTASTLSMATRWLGSSTWSASIP